MTCSQYSAKISSSHNCGVRPEFVARDDADGMTSVDYLAIGPGATA
jgi:hypothetical protein